MKQVAVILLAAAVSLLASCSRQARSESTRTSPDGSMTLITSIEAEQKDPVAFGCVIVGVRDKDSSKVLYRENTHASATQRWNVAWISNDEFKLTSSDIGDVSWKRQPDGGWKKQ